MAGPQEVIFRMRVLPNRHWTLENSEQRCKSHLESYKQTFKNLKNAGRHSKAHKCIKQTFIIQLPPNIEKYGGKYGV